MPSFFGSTGMRRLCRITQMQKKVDFKYETCHPAFAQSPVCLEEYPNVSLCVTRAKVVLCMGLFFALVAENTLYKKSNKHKETHREKTIPGRVSRFF